MIRILVADDHAVIHRGVRQIVSAEPNMVVQGEARTAQEALALVRRQPWDALILDISLPGGGLDLLKAVKQECPKLPVIILSMHPEEQYAVRALKLGAACYLNKTSAPEELVTAIRKVVAGGKYVSPSLAERLAAMVATDTDRPPHERLSDREYQVLRLIASGKSVGQIAEGLSLSVKTVSTYRARILEKMHLENNAQLIHYAIQNRLLD